MVLILHVRYQASRLCQESVDRDALRDSKLGTALKPGRLSGLPNKPCGITPHLATIQHVNQSQLLHHLRAEVGQRNMDQFLSESLGHPPEPGPRRGITQHGHVTTGRIEAAPRQ